MRDALIGHRRQFAFTVVYHCLFPTVTMGFALLVVVMKAMALTFHSNVKIPLLAFVPSSLRRRERPRRVSDCLALWIVGFPFANAYCFINFRLRRGTAPAPWEGHG